MSNAILIATTMLGIVSSSISLPVTLSLAALLVIMMIVIIILVQLSNSD